MRDGQDGRARSGHAAFGVVGAGRIGGMLAGLARAQGHTVHLGGRQGPTCHVEDHGPVVVCTRNDALRDVVARTPPTRRRDLVFVQNGVLAPLLLQLGVPDATVGVLYVAVSARGDTPVPGAPSVFGGPHGATVAGVLAAGGVAAREARDSRDLREQVGTKWVWICATGVLGDALKVSVGELIERHEADLRALCAELAPVLAAHPDTDAPADLADQVVAYSRSVAHYRTAVKEWEWRDGAMLRAAALNGVAVPGYRAWLHRAGFGPAADAVR